MKMSQPDYYAILEVSSSATLEQIKRSYRRLARLYHPDLNQQSEDVRIKQLNEAYNILSNATRRTMYDIQRLEELRRAIMLETIRLQHDKLRREQKKHEKKMTWAEGLGGFVREFKKELRDGP